MSERVSNGGGSYTQLLESFPVWCPWCHVHLLMTIKTLSLSLSPRYIMRVHTGKFTAHSGTELSLPLLYIYLFIFSPQCMGRKNTNKYSRDKLISMPDLTVVFGTTKNSDRSQVVGREHKNYLRAWTCGRR